MFRSCRSVLLAVVASLSAVLALASPSFAQEVDTSRVTCMETAPGLKTCVGPGTEIVRECVARPDGSGDDCRQVAGPPAARAAIGPAVIPLVAAAVRGGVAVARYGASRAGQKVVKSKVAQAGARKLGPPIIRTSRAIKRGGKKAIQAVFKAALKTKLRRAISTCVSAGIITYLGTGERRESIVACVTGAAGVYTSGGN